MGKKVIRGTIVTHCRDDFGEIVVAEEEGTRSLYFADIVQSSIRIDRPEILVEDYNRAIVSALIFKDNPQTVLLIGLGGCSLVNFLLDAIPDCAVDVVEIRQKVIDLARDFFLLSGENPSLRIFHAAGEDFIRGRTGSAAYDLIIVDAFDDGGPAASLIEGDFLPACREHLSHNGVFAINLWSRPKDDFPAHYESVSKGFDGNVLKLSLSEAYWNTIVFGCNTPELFRDLPSYRPKALALRRKYAIDFPKQLKYLYWQNFGNRK